MPSSHIVAIASIRRRPHVAHVRPRKKRQRLRATGQQEAAAAGQGEAAAMASKEGAEGPMALEAASGGLLGRNVGGFYPMVRLAGLCGRPPR